MHVFFILFSRRQVACVVFCFARGCGVLRMKSIFIVEQAVAIALEIGVSDLPTEFLANAFVFFTALQTAGTVAACSLQAFFNGSHHFLVFIKTDRHMHHSSFSS